MDAARVYFDVPKTETSGIRCKDNGICQNGSRCFVNSTTSEEICVCEKFSSGKYCEHSHTFSVCSNSSEHELLCPDGGTCLQDTLTGDKSCLYDPRYISGKLEQASFNVDLLETKNGMGSYHSSKMQMYNIMAIIVGVCALAGVTVVAVYILKKRRAANRGSSRGRKGSYAVEGEGNYRKKGSPTSSIQSGSEEHQTVIDIEPQLPLLPNEQQVQMRPTRHLSMDTDPEIKRQSTPVFRALPAGYVGSCGDINKRDRLHPTRDGTGNPTSNSYRRHRSVDGRLDDDFDERVKNASEQHASPHKRSASYKDKSEFSRRRVTSRSPTLADIPAPNLVPEIVVHEDDVSASDPFLVNGEKQSQESEY